MRSSVRNKEIPVNLSTVHRPVSLDDFTDQELLDMVEKGRQQVRKGNFYTDDKFTKKLNTLYKRYGL